MAARWEKVRSLRRALDGGRAARLGDGRILVVGQRTDAYGDPTATLTAIWDPSTGDWQDGERLARIRTEFALVSLDDGRAMVIGGRNTKDQSFSSSWVFDQDTERWSKVGLMGTARAAPAAALLPDGRVLVAGGYFAEGPDSGSSSSSTVTLTAYRPASPGSKTPLGDVDVPLSGRAMATAELFDPRTGTWSTTGPMRYARAGAAAVTLADGRVLIVGSTPNLGGSRVEILDPRSFRTAEIFDPASGRFSLAGTLPPLDVKAPDWVDRLLPDAVGSTEDVGVGNLVALADGGAILVGLSQSGAHWRSASSTSYRFRPETGTWKEIWEPWVSAIDEETGRSWTSSGRDLGGAVVVTLADGRVLVAGGGGNSGWPDSPVARAARVYDPAANTWSRSPRMPSARTGGVTVPLDDGTILVVGGVDSNRTAVRFVPAR